MFALKRNTRGIGRTIKCRAGVFTSGPTGGSTMGSSTRTKRKGTGCMSGLTVGNTKGSGRTTSNTGKEFTVLVIKFNNMGNGKRV